MFKYISFILLLGYNKNTSIHKLECIDVLNSVCMDIKTRELFFKMYFNYYKFVAHLFIYMRLLVLKSITIALQKRCIYLVIP